MEIMITQVNGISPRIHPSCFVAPGAVVAGDVELGPEVSVWYGAVLRGDINRIRVGARTNIQDGTIIHVEHKGQGVLVGEDVALGHRVVLHSCIIEPKALIGIGAIVLDGAKVGEGAIVAAGAVVPPGAEIPPRTLAMGAPAKPRRELTEPELGRVDGIVDRYLRVSKLYQDPSLSIDFSRDP